MSAPSKLQSFLDSVDALLQGEPLRAIGYGAALVVVIVVAVANALGHPIFGPNISIPDAITATTAAAAVLVGIVEGARRFVYSPATVARIEAGQE